MDIEKLNQVVQEWWKTENPPSADTEVTIRITIKGVTVSTSPCSMTIDELLTKGNFEKAGLPTKIYLEKLRYNLYLQMSVNEFISSYYSVSQNSFHKECNLGEKSYAILTALLRYHGFMK